MSCYKVSIHLIGDKIYSIPIKKVNFISSVWVIRSSTAGLSKKVIATIVCCNGEVKVASVVSKFKMYFYDQFADAADVLHKIGGSSRI